jgi:hypothetical protein
LNAKTEISNLALVHLGVGKQISDLDTDESSQAQSLRTVFDYWMKTVLCGYNWLFATAYVNIEPIQVFPNQEWNFAYRYPADCLFLRRFWNGTHLDDRTNMIPFVFDNDAQGKRILSNFGPGTAVSSAISNMTPPIPVPTPPSSFFAVSAGDITPCIEYTQDFKEIKYFPPEFIWGFSLMLAGWVAPTMPNVGMVDLREKNLNLGSIAMQAAMAHDRMEARPPFQLIGELTKSRNGSKLNMTTAGWKLEPANFTP